MKKGFFVTTPKRIGAVAALAMTLALPVTVQAMSVDDAKRAELVAETSDGYLRVLPGKGSTAVQQLVSETNAARKAKYLDIAKRLKVDLRAVEKDFGQKLMGR